MISMSDLFDPKCLVWLASLCIGMIALAGGIFLNINSLTCNNYACYDFILEYLKGACTCLMSDAMHCYFLFLKSIQIAKSCMPVLNY